MTSKRRKRHKPEQIVAKLRVALAAEHREGPGSGVDHYNHRKPCSSLCSQTPAGFAAALCGIHLGQGLGSCRTR
jgi:hypothetical protein